MNRTDLITSAKNPAIKALNRLLQQARERRKTGLIALEGIHLTQACLDAGGELHALYVRVDARQRPEVVALPQPRPDIEVFPVTAQVLAGLSELSSAPELLALARRPQPSAAAPQTSRLLLEDIQDPGNLGTILRSAAAAGINQIFLSPGCADPWSVKTLRSAMGAHFTLAIHEQVDLVVELSTFAGQKVVTALREDARSLYDCDLTGPVALVFGNEGAGVSPQLLALADTPVIIPMPGQAESLNVAMAATVCLFERVRQNLERRQ